MSNYSSFKHGYDLGNRQSRRTRTLAKVTASFYNVVHGWANWAIPTAHADAIPWSFIKDKDTTKSEDRRAIREFVVNNQIPVYTLNFVMLGDELGGKREYADPVEALRGFRKPEP